MSSVAEGLFWEIFALNRQILGAQTLSWSPILHPKYSS